MLATSVAEDYGDEYGLGLLAGENLEVGRAYHVHCVSGIWRGGL